MKGFTLIELMIVVAVIAILAAIAYPSYIQYVIRSNRSAAQSFLMEVATREEQFLLDKRSYTTSLEDLSAPLPSDIQGKYTVAIQLNLDCASGTCTTPCYCIKATATGNQISDGDLTLNSLGQKSPIGKWK